MKIKRAMSVEELEVCFKIRKMLFVDKEKIFVESDIDEYDFKDTTVHLLAYNSNGEPCGTVRICEEGEGTFRGSRLAVLPGSPPITPIKLIKKAMEVVKEKNGKKFIAYVRPHLKNLFTRCGWIWKGEKINYAGREHIIMYAIMDEGDIFNKKKH